jgi:hypothetical protein
MKVSLNSGALAAFLCHGGLSTTLSSFLAFETMQSPLGFTLNLAWLASRRISDPDAPKAPVAIWSLPDADRGIP